MECIYIFYLILITHIVFFYGTVVVGNHTLHKHFVTVVLFSGAMAKMIAVFVILIWYVSKLLIV
jgi:hypothetical protein